MNAFFSYKFACVIVSFAFVSVFFRIYMQNKKICKIHLQLLFKYGQMIENIFFK